MIHYTYKGYEYRTEEDVEDDNVKIFHYVFKDGKRVDMPKYFYNYSPYSYVSYELFVDAVDRLTPAAELNRIWPL